jgi:nickel-dependent lactate racemase
MRPSVTYGRGTLELEIDPARVVLSATGPASIAPAELERQIERALEQPLEAPPVGTAVVPGDRVVIALGGVVPATSAILAAVCQVISAAGVSRSSIEVLVGPGEAARLVGAMPGGGVRLVEHDPDDRKAHAYLASGSTDRRIYLARSIVDADFVLPIGRIEWNAMGRCEGPWSATFPGFSNRETQKELARAAADGRFGDGSTIGEAAEVCWLLGNLYQFGVIEAACGGVHSVIGGTCGGVHRAGLEGLQAEWQCAIDQDVDLVVAGMGAAGDRLTISDLATGLSNAARVVKPGGAIVGLATVEGPIGPAMKRLSGTSDAADRARALANAQEDDDYPAARALARALDRARVYLLSGLDAEWLEDMGISPLDGPSNVARAVGSGERIAIVGRMERVRVERRAAARLSGRGPLSGRVS